MRITELSPQPNLVLSIVADDGRIGNFDVSPYLEYEAFAPLRDYSEFQKVYNVPRKLDSALRWHGGSGP